MEENPKFIGEGTYGCVSRPSLTCQDSPDMDYTNKVSKLMTKRHAQQELYEYETVLNIPGIEKYLIPKPHICKPNENSAFRDFFSHCTSKNLRKPDVKLRLLILEDGGIALEDVFTLLPKMTIVDFKLFVCSWGKIIDAVCFLATHQIMHHDLKLGNIVYNLQTGSLKFIDFGKVKTMAEFVLVSSQNQNNEGTSWFNYPAENKCTNKKDFLENIDCSQYGMEYEEFIRKAAMTFDMYSIGLVFKELVGLVIKFHDYEKVGKTRFFDSNGIPLAFFEECHILGGKMSDPDLKNRAFTPCEFQEQFANICESYKLKCSSPNKLSATLVKSLENVEHVISLNCRKQNKILNPFTNKCVKKCRKGYVRKKTRKNGLFKCVKKRT